MPPRGRLRGAGGEAAGPPRGAGQSGAGGVAGVRGCDRARLAAPCARDGPVPAWQSRAGGEGGPGADVEVGTEEGASPRRWVERGGG